MKELNKKNPYKTPEDYFEGFTGRLMGKISNEVGRLPESEGFSVPDGYFDDLHHKIEQRLAEPPVKVIPLHRFRKYYYAAAAVAAVALLYIGIQWNVPQEIGFEDLANSDIENYFEVNEFGLSTMEIAEVIPVDELEIGDILERRLNEENVIDYLNNNTDEFEELNLNNDE
ncbi:MAG: hypothetical protein WBN39_10750 [Flavobacteriaceae bacterium]